MAAVPVQRITSWYPDEADPEAVGLTVKEAAADGSKTDEFICVVLTCKTRPELLTTLTEFKKVRGPGRHVRRLVAAELPGISSLPFSLASSCSPWTTLYPSSVSLEQVLAPEAQPGNLWVCKGCQASNPERAPLCEKCGARSPSLPTLPTPMVGVSLDDSFSDLARHRTVRACVRRGGGDVLSFFPSCLAPSRSQPVTLTFTHTYTHTSLSLTPPELTHTVYL